MRAQLPPAWVIAASGGGDGRRVSFYDIYPSEVGPIFIGASDAGVRRIDFITLDRDEATCD